MYEIFENLLKSKGVTAYKVACETGVSQSTLSDWKRGRSVPKIDKLQKIADYFDVTVDYLMGIKKHIVEDLELEYVTVIREAKEKGYSADDVRIALKLLDLARSTNSTNK